MRPVNAHNALYDAAEFDRVVGATRLRRFLEARQLLLQLGKEVLPAGHEVWHVACVRVSLVRQCCCCFDTYLVSPTHRCSALPPSRPGPCGTPTIGLWVRG